MQTVNEALQKRRKQHVGIIKRSRIYLLATLILTFTNSLSIVIGFVWIALPYGLTSVQACLEYALKIKGENYSWKFTAAVLIFLALYALFIKAWFSMNESYLWTRIAWWLFIGDFAVTLVMTIINFVPEFFTTLLYLIDIALHVFVMLQLGRAKRSHYALILLPERETEEDPYETFGERQTHKSSTDNEDADFHKSVDSDKTDM